MGEGLERGEILLQTLQGILMTKAAILLPNQLFADHPALLTPVKHVVLFEDPLFFGDPQYPARMHRQKLWLHRASMARYHQALVKQGMDA